MNGGEHGGGSIIEQFEDVRVFDKIFPVGYDQICDHRLCPREGGRWTFDGKSASVVEAAGELVCEREFVIIDCAVSGRASSNKAWTESGGGGLRA